MSTLEAVARAIWPDRWAEHDGLRVYEPALWASLAEVARRQGMLDRARAAVAALREPSEAAMAPGQAASASFESEAEDFPNGWQATIDAILEGH